MIGLCEEDLAHGVHTTLRICDGAVIVVSVGDGDSTSNHTPSCEAVSTDRLSGDALPTQTATLLRSALALRIRPLLMLNKLDVPLASGTPEATYQRCLRIIASTNDVTSLYNDDTHTELHPSLGNVVFGSGLGSWSFTLKDFVGLYSKKLEINESKLLNRIWGDHFYDAKTKRWGEDSGSGERGFCQFCLEPLWGLAEAVLNGKEEKLARMLRSLKITVNRTQRDLTPSRRLQAILKKLLPSKQLLHAVVTALPSPLEAQTYRTPLLYDDSTIDIHDPGYLGVSHCSPTAPLTLFIASVVPYDGRLFAFGRVFSGTVSRGEKLRAGRDHIRQGSMVAVFGKWHHPVGRLVCGNLCALDLNVKVGATVSDGVVCPLKSDVGGVSVVQAEVACEVRDLPKLVNALRHAARRERTVDIAVSETGAHTVAGSTEDAVLHCLARLRSADYPEAGYRAPCFTVSDLSIRLRETITEASNRQCTAMSPNRHNVLYCKGFPLPDAVCTQIEEGTYKTPVWCFGPAGGPNVVVDVTKGVQYMQELKDSVGAAWTWLTGEGVLCGEVMRGVRVDIEHATLHADAIHRGAGQIIPTMRDAARACILTAAPRLMVPIFRLDVTTTLTSIDSVYTTLQQRRCTVLGESTRGTMFNV